MGRAAEAVIAELKRYYTRRGSDGGGAGMTFRELLERSLRVDDSFLDAEEASALLEAAVSDVVASECPGYIFHGAR